MLASARGLLRYGGGMAGDGGAELAAGAGVMQKKCSR